jgi:hypothetical protein
MTRVQIPSDPFDIEFRTKVASYIRKAKKTIQIVTGEIGAYDYLDLRNAAEDAADKGVKIEVYASSPEPAIVHRLLSFNVNVYLGNEDPEKHFMIIDGKEVIISFKERNRQRPTPIGERKAVISNNIEDLRKCRETFSHLKNKATKQVLSDRDPVTELFA